ncbi:MAG: hypothetical protein ACJ76H_09400 [Bacteriovoracaceae bacterium]
MKLLSLVFTLTLITSTSWGATQSVLEESLYFDYQKVILDQNFSQKGMTGFSSFEQGLFVDALWDLVEEKNPEALKALDTLQTFHYDLYEKLRIGILRMKYRNASVLPNDLVQELVNALREPDADLKLIYTIAAYESELTQAGHTELLAAARTHQEFFIVADDADRKKELTDTLVGDIFHNSPDVSTYMNGEYVKAVKIFMFCRSNRIYPCLMTMKDAHGEVVRNTDGTLWTHKALASAKTGLPYYNRNGNTPTGVMTIDSVMPVADQPISFGKFRRMVLNFIPKSKNETLIRSLIPESSREEDWWKEGVTARDIGRNLLRIHGTGKINPDPDVPYFPFMRTSGCIAQRENTYGDVTFQDQRDLLDAIMKALDLEPKFENEPKIKGILYIVEIDDTDEVVTPEALASFGIE